jgi:hypothetical protein
VTNYTLGVHLGKLEYEGFPFRVRYGLPFGGAGADLYLDAPTLQKNIFPNRMIAAKLMETEIRTFTGGQIGSKIAGYTTVPGWYIEEAISELNDFVRRP